MRHRYALAFPLLLALLLARTAGAAVGDEAKRVELTPFVGWTLFDREFRTPSPPMLQNDVEFGGRLALRLHSALWFEAAGGVTMTSSPAQDVRWGHLTGNLMLRSPTEHVISPFVSVGGGFSQFRPQLTSDKSDGVLDAAAGVRVRFSDAIGLRLEARNLLFVPREHFKDAHLDNIVLGAGLSFGFGGRARDTDGDGVTDRRDHCPGTPAGCKVDVQGCPIDADGDGVCDGIDQCPNTPRGVRVDAHGCPLDDDRDGVFNGIDQCPDTPRGCKVDARGCPIDTDHDGICDGVDQCDNTPMGCTVDARGCVIDSDGDGVCDGLDKCPNTPSGAKVDADGCPLTEVKLRETELLDTGMIRLQNVNFETARATLLPESKPILNVVGEVLSRWPQLR